MLILYFKFGRFITSINFSIEMWNTAHDMSLNNLEFNEYIETWVIITREKFCFLVHQIAQTSRSLYGRLALK